ncbi:hypothetical protein KK083_10065 [Fulvivirgaceae bacterium PWU4]|uniref:Uncharacterized protein n=1 Tax=Chryseosolibacter histidini TaxID=2782349 RepID=A0AAP2GIH0_9BACT|nr:hypothetical protein [Chryseosolibacter histidini]MBT1697221.1 hypothetical protein [Chryseosolibacter histidini]
MNLQLKSNGLSARRRTIDKIKKIISSISNLAKWRSLLVLLATTSLMISSCHEKTNGQDNRNLQKDQASVAQDSLNKPKVNIKVNRRYDDKGNLIGFDSTYSSFYSNVKGDTSKMDSLMGRFDRYFNSNHSSLFDRQFNSLFFTDSLRYPDFFHHDFFMKRYEMNDDYLKGMMHRMDSIKNRFYQDLHKKPDNSKEL